MQSFADLWVDFLLKETEEREKRESAAGASEEDQNKVSPSTSENATLPDPAPSIATATSSFVRPNAFSHQNRSTIPSRGTILQLEATESEFSTVPLSSSENSSQVSRLLARYS